MNLPATPDFRDPAVASTPIVEDEIFNLRSAVAAVLDYWKVAAAIVAAGIVIGFYKIWIASPLYEASALVEIETKSSGFAVGPESMGMDSYFMPQAVSAQIEILRSRRILGDAAEQMGLVVAADPMYWGRIGAALARHHGGDGLASAPWFIPGSSKYAWGGESIDVAELKLSPSRYGQVFLLRAGEGGHYTLTDEDKNVVGEGQVGVRFVSKPGTEDEIQLMVSSLVARPGTLFTIVRMKTQDAADWLRSSMRVTERGAKSVYGGSGILEITMKAGAPRLAADIANAVAESYLRQNVERLSQGAERKLEFLNSQLPRLQTEVESAEEALLEQKTKGGSYQLSEGAKAILDTLTTVEKEISELELERAELSQTVTAQHPAMAAVNRKLEQLQSERSRINARLATLPDAESRLLQLTRDSKVSSELYISLLNKAQELKIAKAGTIGNVHIIDTAVPVNYRVEPRAQSILMSWTGLGVVLGLVVVFLRKHLNVRLEWAEDAERRIGIPVYATIPFSDKETRLHANAKRNRDGGARTLLAEADPKDVAVESLRSLRASLHFAMMEAKRNLVVITGSTPDVGKSFVASNLARLVADSGKKVLLIDADMRKGRMHKIFGLERNPGLSEAIAGQVPIAEAIRKVGENFYLVTTGRIPPNPAELLASDRFVEIVEGCCKDFGIVLVDTPPILNLADTVVIAKSAGALFVTIRGGESTVPDVQDCIQRFAKNGIKVDGLIFNGLRPGVGSYVHPQYYHYRYRYGRYRYGGTTKP